MTEPASDMPTPDRIQALPGIGPLTDVQFAGYAPVSGEPDDNAAEAIFYWFAGEADYRDRPTILWSNGGPGCSSLWGFMVENGPFVFHENAAGEAQIARNPHGWNRQANYLVFEHPLGVTLSFPKQGSALPQDVQAGVRQLYGSLIAFMRRHPEVAARPLVLAGESYAGTYLPLLAELILEGNRQPGNPVLDLRSLVLADAWVDPMTQMATDTTYALSHGLITAAQKAQLDAKYAHNYPQVNQAIQQICGLYMANTAQAGDPPFQPVLDYINRPEVRAALHAPATPAVTASWSEAISDLYAFGVNDSVIGTVQALVDAGLQLIVVSGLNDAKDCNFLGTGAWLEKLEGDAAARFHAAPTVQWKEPGKDRVLGFFQDGGSVSWIKVLNAGHLAARDQPRLIDLLRRSSRAWQD